jgi:predicted nucleic acid-binding protein
MAPLRLRDLPDGSPVLLDSAPIIYFLEVHPKLAPVFSSMFERQASGDLHFAVMTITIAEILTGPLQSENEALAERYRAVLESWRVVDRTIRLAESAARLGASLRLKLPDAIQAASAIAINADALVTHDRDFSLIRKRRTADYVQRLAAAPRFRTKAKAVAGDIVVITNVALAITAAADS